MFSKAEGPLIGGLDYFLLCCQPRSWFIEVFPGRRIRLFRERHSCDSKKLLVLSRSCKRLERSEYECYALLLTCTLEAWVPDWHLTALHRSTATTARHLRARRSGPYRLGVSAGRIGRAAQQSTPPFQLE